MRAGPAAADRRAALGALAGSRTLEGVYPRASTKALSATGRCRGVAHRQPRWPDRSRRTAPRRARGRRAAMTDATDVLVVGAGPVGVVLTRLPGELGIRTTLSDRELNVLRVPRAIALDDDGGRVLQSIGDYTQLRKRMPRIERVRLVSTTAGEVLSIDASCWRNG